MSKIEQDLDTVIRNGEVEGGPGKEQSPTPRPNKIFGVRHLQILLLFLCLTIAYSLRVNMSVAIVSMSNKTSTGVDFPEYNWDTQTRGYILSSFFWGYVVTQVPAGQLAQRFGAKILLTCSLLITSIFTLLTPLAASSGEWGLVCACRVIQGLCQGFIFPSVHTLLSLWAPIEEQSRFTTYVYAGAQFGTIIAMAVCGALSTSSIGWPSIFYVFGAFGVAWTALWIFFGAASPHTHKFISAEEREYIETNLGSKHSNDSKRPTPWLSIFTSLPMWALLIAHCGQNWGFWTLLTEMPTYMNDVLNYELSANGLLSALPYLVMWLMSFVFGWASDYLITKKIISTAVSRKIFNTIAHWIPGAALIGLAFSSKENTAGAVALLTVAVGVNSATYVGFQINHIDLSPNYAGTLMGITNGASNIMSIIAPILAGLIVTEQGNELQWRTVFFISSAIYFAGNLIFIIFGKAEVQSWNDPKNSSDKEKSKIGQISDSMKY